MCVTASSDWTSSEVSLLRFSLFSTIVHHARSIIITGSSGLAFFWINIFPYRLSASLFFSLCLFVYKLFPWVYLVSQWPSALLKLCVPLSLTSLRRLRAAPHFFVVPLIFHRAYPASLIWSRCHLATFSPFIPFQVTAYIAVNLSTSLLSPVSNVLVYLIWKVSPFLRASFCSCAFSSCIISTYSCFLYVLSPVLCILRLLVFLRRLVSFPIFFLSSLDARLQFAALHLTNVHLNKGRKLSIKAMMSKTNRNCLIT